MVVFYVMNMTWTEVDDLHQDESEKKKPSNKNKLLDSIITLSSSSLYTWNLLLPFKPIYQSTRLDPWFQIYRELEDEG